MGLPVLHKRDPGGMIGSALGNALIQGSQQAMKERGDARSEQRRMLNARQEQEYQESRLKQALQAAYNDPNFKDADVEGKQRIITEHVTPINPQVAKQIGDFNIDAYKAKNPVAKPKAGQATPEQQQFITEYRASPEFAKKTDYEAYVDVLNGTGDKSLATAVATSKRAEQSNQLKKDEILSKGSEKSNEYFMKQFDKEKEVDSILETLGVLDETADEVGAGSRGHIAEALKMPWLDTPGSALFKSGSKKLFTDFRSIFPKGTNADLIVYGQMLPLVGRDPLANRLVIQQKRSELAKEKERFRLEQEVFDENPQWNLVKIRKEADSRLKEWENAEYAKFKDLLQEAKSKLSGKTNKTTNNNTYTTSTGKTYDGLTEDELREIQEIDEKLKAGK